MILLPRVFGLTAHLILRGLVFLYVHLLLVWYSPLLAATGAACLERGSAGEVGKGLV